MRNRTVLIISSVLATMLWAALILLMNYVSPDTFGQALFLLVWGLAVLSTGTPLAYWVNVRWGRPLGPKGDLARAFRQGMFVAMLAVLLMALRLLRMLNLLTAVILIAIVAIMELLFQLRKR